MKNNFQFTIKLYNLDKDKNDFSFLLQYLTTVIPYHTDSGPPDNQALQVLIKSKYLIAKYNLITILLFFNYINDMLICSIKGH